MCCGMLVVIRETGRIGEYRIGTSQLLGTVVHFLDKGIHRSADLFCDLESNVIGRGQHQSIKALLHGKYLSEL